MWEVAIKQSDEVFSFPQTVFNSVMTGYITVEYGLHLLTHWNIVRIQEYLNSFLAFK